MWRDRSVGKGTVTYADGNLYILQREQRRRPGGGSPAGYKEKGRFAIADKGLPELGPPGRQRRNAVRPRNQDTLTALQHPGEVRESNAEFATVRLEKILRVLRELCVHLVLRASV